MLSYSTVLLSVLCWSVRFAFSRGETSLSQDTYINALENSHQSDTEFGGDFGGYNYSPPLNNQYLPPSTPAPFYGPPAPVYGPPAPVYGPPQSSYYKPIPYNYHPHAHLSLLEKLKTKINLFTIGKILLKLLKDMFKEDMANDDDGLESKHVETEKHVLEKRIDEIYEFAMEAFDKFQEYTT